MIRVTVEMFPQGNASRKYSLGHFDIFNTSTTTDKRHANYGTRFFSRTGAKLGRKPLILNWPRLTRPVMSLVREALEQAGF